MKISEKYLENWVQSEHKGIEYGKFVLSHGSFWNDPDNDKGMLKKRGKFNFKKLKGNQESKIKKLKISYPR